MIKKLIGKAQSTRSLSFQIASGYLGSAVVAAVATGIGAYIVSSGIVRQDVQNKLQVVSASQNHGLDTYVTSVSGDLDFLMHSDLVRDSLSAFSNSWDTTTPDGLRNDYIDSNPNPIGSKHLLDAAPETTPYNVMHGRFHPDFRTLLELRGYYDIFLISPSGDIVYSVFKELDYATNLQSGAYKDSGLGVVFREALLDTDQAFVDFEPYAPSYGAPAAFVAAPVAGKQGEQLGVIALQIPSNQVAAAVASQEEVTTYIVGQDGFLRSDLAETETNDILQKRVDASWLEGVFSSGESVVLEEEGILGGPTLLSAMRADVFDEQWVVVTERPIASALAPLDNLRNTLLIVVLSIMLAIASIGFLLAQRLSKTISALANSMLRIANGKIEGDIPGETREDEIGQMAQALRTFQKNAGVQLAVTAAVRSNKTPMVVLDGAGNVITQNPAFDKLWEDVGATLKDYTKPSDTGQASGSAVSDLNFLPLLKKVEELEADGTCLKTKVTGDQALDLSYKGVVVEVKFSPIRDTEGTQIGSAVEMSNVTSVRALENELIDVIEAVNKGAFDKRVTYIDNLGFTSMAASGMNGLMEAVNRFMSELDEALAALADGDLTRLISNRFQGDFKCAADRFNSSVNSLSTTIQQVERAAGEVRADADPIAKGSRDLASRAESQAATLEQTSATMEEMSASIRENAQKAQNGADLSTRASELAKAGGDVVTDTVSAMARIEESSTKISDIISVIEGIAFQTNLLALNAAVEAARAGEAGKGFAVVASEVRTLAQRSSEASSDIKQLIAASTENVSAGVALVNKTGESLENIVGAVQSVAETIADISDAVKEQATGVSDISSSVAHLDDMTQQNSALADQSASSANNLLKAASNLTAMIGGFTTTAAPGQGAEMRRASGQN